MTDFKMSRYRLCLVRGGGKGACAPGGIVEGRKYGILKFGCL